MVFIVRKPNEKLKNILTPEKAEESAVAKVTDGERAKAVAAVRQLLQGINSKARIRFLVLLRHH